VACDADCLSRPFRGEPFFHYDTSVPYLD
jgi:hypothetical protein